MCPPLLRLRVRFFFHFSILTGRYDKGGHMARPYEGKGENQIHANFNSTSFPFCVAPKWAREALAGPPKTLPSRSNFDW